MRVDGYVRVSRVGGRDGDRFISPDVQREQIEAWARLRHATVAEVHTDLDMSGAKRDRPGLEAAIARVQRREIDGIVVAKLDRLARSLPVAFDAIARIEEAGGKLVSVDEGIDPSTPNGRLMRNLLLTMAEWYREQIREQWTVARERAIQRGLPVMSIVATGYRRRDDGRLEPDPVWGPVVREAFERRAAGEPLADLARFMTAAGVPTKHAGAGRWTGSTVGKLLKGRVYLGEARSGQFVNRGAHEPLVTAATWQAAQAARPVSPGRGGSPALLAGLVRCAGCGYGMYRDTGRGAAGGVTVSYRCRGGGSAGVCTGRGFASAEALEGLVADVFLAHAEGLAVRGSAETAEMDGALEVLAEAEEALRVFRDDPRIIGALGPDGFAEGLQQRARAVDDARARVAAARAPVAGIPDVMELRGIWPAIEVSQRRRLLTAAIDCVVVAGRGPLTADRVRVCWAGLAPDDLPARGKRDSRVRPIPLDSLPPETRVEL